MRLFIGIPLAPEVTQQLALYVQRLRKAGDDLRWSEPESWHITLQFLGSTTAEQYDCVVAGLRQVQGRQFDIQVKDPGFFDRAGIFYVDIPPSPELTALQQQVTSATQPCGFQREDRLYHPHITLARNRGRSNGVRGLKPQINRAPQFSSFTAQEFLLYESHLKPRGARYEVRERFPLH